MSTGAVAVRGDDLVDAFDAEARQLDTLASVLRRQRDGVARDDVAVVEDTVYAIHRVLLTLEEARRRRRTLLERISAEPASAADGRDSGSSEVPESAAADSRRRARERLLAAARSLETEIALNRRVLESALSVTHAEMRAVLGRLGEEAIYAVDPDSEDGARTGVLIDRQV